MRARRRDVYLVAGVGHEEGPVDVAIAAAVQGLSPIVLVPRGRAPELAAEVIAIHDLVTVGWTAWPLIASVSTHACGRRGRRRPP